MKALGWRNFKVAIQGIGLGCNFDVKNKEGGGDLVGNFNFNLNGLMQRRNSIYVKSGASWRTCSFIINPLTPNDPYRGSYRTANL